MMFEFGLGLIQIGATACLSLFFPLLRWILHVNIFEPLALSCLRPVWQQSGSKTSPERMQNGVEKFCESVWKLMVYIAFLTVGVTSVWREPWVLDTWQFWRGWPNHPFTPPMQLLYNLELGFYISSIFMILFWEVRRKDFLAMFSHHIVTVILVSASMYFSFWRVGTVVMLLHDVNDVLMEAAKLFKYCKKEHISLGLFIAFFIAWLALRLTCFPLMVIRSTLFELPETLGGRPPLYYVFNSLLIMLFILHCYWFTLILKVVCMTLTVGEAQDVREDD